MATLEQRECGNTGLWEVCCSQSTAKSGCAKNRGSGTPPVLTEPLWCFPAPAGTSRHLCLVPAAGHCPSARAGQTGCPDEQSLTCLSSGAKSAELMSSKCHQLQAQVLHS